MTKPWEECSNLKGILRRNKLRFWKLSFRKDIFDTTLTDTSNGVSFARGSQLAVFFTLSVMSFISQITGEGIFALWIPTYLNRYLISRRTPQTLCDHFPKVSSTCKSPQSPWSSNFMYFFLSLQLLFFFKYTFFHFACSKHSHLNRTSFCFEN